jgi:hypothetical protein
MEPNSAQMFNRSPASEPAGWCPVCGQPMDWFDTPGERWIICDSCRVAFCPEWAIGLGIPSEGWEAQVYKTYEYRWLTGLEYYGPDWDPDLEDTGPFSA